MKNTTKLTSMFKGCLGCTSKSSVKISGYIAHFSWGWMRITVKVLLAAVICTTLRLALRKLLHLVGQKCSSDIRKQRILTSWNEKYSEYGAIFLWGMPVSATALQYRENFGSC